MKYFKLCGVDALSMEYIQCLVCLLQFFIDADKIYLKVEFQRTASNIDVFLLNVFLFFRYMLTSIDMIQKISEAATQRCS